MVPRVVGAVGLGYSVSLMGADRHPSFHDNGDDAAGPASRQSDILCVLDLIEEQRWHSNLKYRERPHPAITSRRRLGVTCQAAEGAGGGTSAGRPIA